MGKKEKVAPALADGGSACGRCRSVGHHLPWWQCRGDEEGRPALAVGAVRVGGAGTGAIYLDGSVGEKEKAAPAPAEGAVRWAVQECGASIALVAVSMG